ncbi:MAG: RagB/SusD family nutrient uptake outer membrane protein [Balneolales bacterium]
MKRLIKYPIILAILFLTVTACSENFLQPEPKSFFAPENIYTDQSGFEAQLVTLRKNLTNEHSGARGTALIHSQWIFGETHIGGAFMHFERDLGPITSSDWFRINGTIEDMYQFIKDANVVISRINDIEWDSQEDKELILAEALWHRAYWYNRMVNSYGDVPFIGEEIQSGRVDFQTHTRGAILDKIQSDLEDYVIGVLPPSVEPGAISNGAANHLLTRVAMSNADWDTAIEAATRVIDGPYDLMTDRFGVEGDDPKHNVIWDLHREENVHAGDNTETILATVDRYSDPDDVKSAGSYRAYKYNPSWHHSRVQDSDGGACTYRPSEAEVDTLLGGAQWDTLGQGATSAPPNQFFQYHVWEDDGYTYQDTPDLRRRGGSNWWEIDEILCNVPESVDYGQPALNAAANGTIGGQPPGLIHTSLFAANVYKTYYPEQDGTPNGGNADLYIFRLAETLLLRAEAYHWNNQPGLAADDINEVRERAGAEPINANEVTIEYIFDETIRELFFETPRQNDLIRVALYLAEEGMSAGYGNTYSMDGFAESNWAYDRIINTNDFYPQYEGPYIGDTTPIGFELPLGFEYRFTSGTTPTIAPHHVLWPINGDFIQANTQGTINQNEGYTGTQNNEPPLETIEAEDYLTE